MQLHAIGMNRNHNRATAFRESVSRFPELRVKLMLISLTVCTPVILKPNRPLEGAASVWVGGLEDTAMSPGFHLGLEERKLVSVQYISQLKERGIPQGLSFGAKRAEFHRAITNSTPHLALL